MTKEMLQDIKQLGYAKLFGSRSMANRSATTSFDPAVMIGSQITATTDWDYSQSYSEESHNYLTAAGFTCYRAEDMAHYADDLTVAVYVKEYLGDDGFFPTHCVNVVLHSDEALFRQVWNSISPEFYYTHLWKRSPHYDGLDSTGEIKLCIKQVMNQLYATARSMI